MYLTRRADLLFRYMKLGLMGVTMMYSTGDTGVGCFFGKFAPTFPASCPYVTAVGGTQIPQNGSVTDKEVAARNISSGYASGGGFSNLFPIQEYQEHAVAAYFTDHAPRYITSSK